MPAPVGTDSIGATGRLVQLLPPGPERDEFLGLVRLGVSFRVQQRGKRPGFLRRYVQSIVDRLEAPVTFEALLDELELEAARRELYGEGTSPVESVNRAWKLVTYHDPRNGRQQRAFNTMRNILKFCKQA